MDFREERVTRNEVRARELNERIQESYESHPIDAQTDILCECGIEDCDVFIRITKAEYEDVEPMPGSSSSSEITSFPTSRTFCSRRIDSSSWLSGRERLQRSP